MYKIRAKFIEEKLGEFYEKLTDGEEIVSSMKQAGLTEPGLIECFEMCFCPTPLQHEGEIQYDFYFSKIDTKLVHSRGEIEGKSFWCYVASVISRDEGV